MPKIYSYGLYEWARNADRTETDLYEKYKNKRLYFSYANVTFDQYSKISYESYGYIKRKVAAIPAALIAGVFKTAYHLALTIF